MLRSPNSKKLLLVCFRVEEGSISSQSKFVDNLGVYSVDLAELMMLIKAAFDCDAPNEEVSEIVEQKIKIKITNQTKSIR